MQKVTAIALLLALLTGGRHLVAQATLDNEIDFIVKPLIAKMNTKAAIKTIAVADFTRLDGTPTELGKYLAERFSDAFANSDITFSVVDRSYVNYLLKEAGLEGKGLMDANTVAKLGKLKGIDAIVTATMAPTGENIGLTVKALQLETSIILASKNGSISRTPAIIELEVRELGGAEGVAKSNPDPAKPKKAPGAAIQSFTVEPMVFECLECKQAGEQVICKFTITNKGGTQLLTVNNGYWGSKFFDDEGNQYNLNFIRLANWTGNQPVSAWMVEAIGTSAEFTFTGVKRKVSYIPQLDLTGKIGEEEFWFPMKNLPVMQN